MFPDSVQTITHLVAEGNVVAVWTTYEGTQQGPMGPFPPSGRRARFDFGAVFRVEHAKIAEWWVTWDNMVVLRALGCSGSLVIRDSISRTMQGANNLPTLAFSRL